MKSTQVKPISPLGGETSTTTSIIAYSPDLQYLLEKLRPFQREAFEFATQGVSYNRQWAADSEDSGGQRKQRQGRECQNAKGFQYDSNLLGKGRILLADEMGLGKTVTSLAIMSAYMDEWPLLILCPASLRYMWPTEIEKFLPSISPNAIYVVSGFDDADFYANENKRKRIKIVIATFSLLQTRAAAARVLDQFDFKCVIVDESHNLKERNSQRCQLGLPLLQKAKRLVLLTGTPALARPVELWAQVSCIAPELFGSYTTYTKNYCNARRGRFGWDVSGLSNAEELHYKLRQVMVRRLKCDVLTELPPKQRSIIPIDIDVEDTKESRDLMEELKQARVSVAELVGNEANRAHFEARRLLMKAYQISGVAKARSVADYLVDWLSGSGTQKILVFGHHKEVLDTLEHAVSKKFKGAGHIRIDGTVPSSERAARVRKFQSNPQVRVGLLSMTAAGVGLTLTAASSVMFAELHWTPGVLAQAEDRCHRIGQQNAVNVIYCVCKDQELSVDMSLWAMLSRKVGMIGRVIDGFKVASMDATDCDPKELTRGKPQSGASGEDELATFFAEASVAELNQARSQVPVKGSILSFFKPPTMHQPSSPTFSKQTPKVKAAEVDSNPQSARDDDCSWILSDTQHKDRNPLIEWQCDACTFANSQSKPKSGWLCCQICQTPHYGDHLVVDGGTRAVSPMDYSRVVTNDHDVIVIDDDRNVRRDKYQTSIDVIDLNVQGTVSIVTPAKLPRTLPSNQPLAKRETDSTLLNFSASNNTGRISIHCANTSDAYRVNFDVEQVVTDETREALLNVGLRRSRLIGNLKQPLTINFDEIAVKQVVSSIDTSSNREQIPDNVETQCCEELKMFVSSYLSLLEIEKKAFKEWGKPASPFALRQTVARVMTSSVNNLCTERYAGGAKERAIERKNDGTAKSIDHAVIDGEACAWCAGSLPETSLAVGVEATYCSQKCAEEGRLGRGGMYASTRVRSQVFAIEGGVCRKCGIDAYALYLRISSLQPAERLNALCNANWQLPKSASGLERLLQRPKEGDFWQADHILAVAEGGGGCGLDNLQTLCTPCHKADTVQLRARIRLGLGHTTHEGLSASSKRKQMDIRTAFSIPGPSESNGMDKRIRR